MGYCLDLVQRRLPIEADMTETKTPLESIPVERKKLS